MASDPDNSASRVIAQGIQTSQRVINIYQIIGLVLLWNAAFKASRVCNTLSVVCAGKLTDRHGVPMPLNADIAQSSRLKVEHP